MEGKYYSSGGNFGYDKKSEKKPKGLKQKPIEEQLLEDEEKGEKLVSLFGGEEDDEEERDGEKVEKRDNIFSMLFPMLAIAVILFLMLNYGDIFNTFNVRGSESALDLIGILPMVLAAGLLIMIFKMIMR